MVKRGWHDDASQTLRQLKREEGMIARSEIETIFQLIDVAEGRSPHTNHRAASYLDQISLMVVGRGNNHYRNTHVQKEGVLPIEA
jgi:hypothetical protein